MKNEKVVIEQNPEAPVETKVLAQAIVNISTSLRALRKSGLNQRAVVALVKDDTNMTKAAIERVIRSLDDLAKTYTTR